MSGSVCAIVINYFGAENTAECISSLAIEPLDTILLVDNSASIEQRQAMSGIVANARRSGCNAEVRQIDSPSNLGFGRAINLAIRSDREQTGGHDYYLLMNNDAVASPRLVESLLHVAEGPQRPALVSPEINWGGASVNYYWYQPVLGHVSRDEIPGSFRYLSGCCLLVDSALFMNGELFDERFFMYGEDIALTAKALQAGRSIVCTADASVYHKGSASSGIGSFFYEYHVTVGHLLLARVLSNGFWQTLYYSLGRTAYLPTRALFRLLKGRTLTPVIALAKALAATARTS